MKSRHSNSLLFVWRVAEVEAKHLNAPELEPVHLLIGLAKTVDLDLPTLVSKNTADRDAILEELLREVRRLRTVFSTAQVSAKALRRKLRGTPLDQRFRLPESESLHRSTAARKVFADAEHFAQLSNSVVYPAHLLHALLLNDDDTREEAFQALGVDKKRFLEVARREVVPLHSGQLPDPHTKTTWN
ncbi:MAG TPA: Clp protease N-terminal domain-containing protein [Verrucomicrobiota bacterium]|jgi:ATP-dependent Clp protease ATP-binding subunit ClpA|nr:Clp protease N-terminal domain-containing protein [Verrucomicrobiota bacterium]